MNEQEQSAGLPVTSNYRYATRVDDQLFVAGQVPHDSDAQLVAPGDASSQAAQCLANLKTLLELHGFSERDIRQLVVYVVGDQSNLTEAWHSVAQWFENSVPPATLLGVARLGYVDQLVEIDATIVKEPHLK